MAKMPFSVSQEKSIRIADICCLIVAGDKIDTSNEVDLRDRALLGTLAYTFARIGAVVNLKVEDYFQTRKAIIDPVPGERRQGDGDPRAPQTGGAS